MATFCRSKFGEYKEYHTSADNLSILDNESLNDSLNVLKSIIDAFEIGLYPRTAVKGEPQLSKYNLYPTISQKGTIKKGSFSKQEFINRCNVLAYSDGLKNIFEISNNISMPLDQVVKELILLKKFKLIV